MTRAVPTVRLGGTVGDIERTVLRNAGSFDTIDYIYVVDEAGALRGVISIKEVLRASRKDAKVEEVMTPKPVVAHASTDQERLVYLALSHGIKEVPVVDKEGRLLGAVTYDTLLQIFNHEVHEDVFKFGGIFPKVGKEFATITSPATMMMKARLPWLVVGVLGGAIAASIVSSFEGVLSRFLTLAAFIPVLVYMSDAAGTQSEALIVRSMALDPRFSTSNYVVRELKVAVVLALVCGLLLSAVALLGWNSPVLGAIVGASIVLSLIVSVLIATLLPLLFRSMNADPAVAAGPFATLLSDMVTIVIYFLVASALLNYFGI